MSRVETRKNQTDQVPSKATQVTKIQTAPVTLRVAQIALLSALIAIGTVITNLLIGIPLPYPLYEITLAPAFYFAIAVLYSRKVSFLSTAIGSAIGEALNVLLISSGPAIFIPGIVWARAPEVLIIYRFRDKSNKWLATGMVLATAYETLAFFFPDWLIYSYTFLGGSSPQGLSGGLALALFDFGTLIDIVWIPVALAIIQAARRAFNVKFFE